MLVFSIICVLIVLVQSPLRTDCYTSFSMPVIYIKLSHYYPNGPLYLNGTFEYTHSSLMHNHIKWFSVSYQFKRVDHKCMASVLFSSLGYDLKTLNVDISLYFNTEERIAHIEYEFHKGFRTGVYKMLDTYQHFLLHAKIIDDEKNYLNVSSSSADDDVQTYLNSISVKDNALCVITENNPAVILKISYEENTKHGYITGFMAEFFLDGTFIGTRIYPAFGCNKDERNNDEPVMLIIDGIKFTIDLFVLDINFTKTRFKIDNPEFEYVFNLQNIPRDYTKIFLMKHKQSSKMCPDGSLINYYLSKYYTVYFARVYDTIFVAPLVNFYVNLYRSPKDLCNENKNN